MLYLHDKYVVVPASQVYSNIIVCINQITYYSA